MSELEDFTILWQECGGNGIATRFYVPGFEGHLPFFISGDAYTAMKNGEGIGLDERQLLEGILYGLHEFDNFPKPWTLSDDRNTLLLLLDKLGPGFRFESGEELILQTAHSLRLRNGNSASRVALLSGIKLDPFSSKIRSDLICDTWSVAAESNDRKLLEPIPELVMETTLSQLIPQAKESICYYGLCAMVLLERNSDEIDAYLNDFIYPNIEFQELKVKIKNLLETPNAYSIKDMEIS